MIGIKRVGAFVGALGLFAATASAGSYEDCLLNPQFQQDLVRGVQSCTEVLDNPAWPLDVRAQAYAQRALAHSMRGDFPNAISDYDQAIRMFPNFAIALNNRAWALFRSGQPEKGLPDVEKSLRLNPYSGHAFDTRAHIRQWMGDVAGAIADYDRAIELEGERLIKLYQCGLGERGIYKGLLDGKDSPELRQAIRTCAARKQCDPLPEDENCRPRTS